MAILTTLRSSTMMRCRMNNSWYISSRSINERTHNWLWCLKIHQHRWEVLQRMFGKTQCISSARIRTLDWSQSYQNNWATDVMKARIRTFASLAQQWWMASMLVLCSHPNQTLSIPLFTTKILPKASLVAPKLAKLKTNWRCPGLETTTGTR